jgi:hypothetical protein
VIDLPEVRSVTEFERNLKDYVGRLKEKKTPMALRVNGRAEAVVQDADSYQWAFTPGSKFAPYRSGSPNDYSVPRPLNK